MPVYKTKGELRSKLLIRLGYGGLGAAAANFVQMADDLLEEAQEQIFEMLNDDENRETTWDLSVVADQQWSDFPSTCDPDEIKSVQVQINGTWLPVHKGIDMHHDSYADNKDYPRRYDLRYNNDGVNDKQQIEWWPMSDATYTVRIEGVLQLGAFEADDDRATIDHRLILLYALAFGKGHLRHPDSGSYADAFKIRIGRLRGKQHGNKRYVRGEIEKQPIPKPVVV